jgi:hypothetical protein
MPLRRAPQWLALELEVGYRRGCGRFGPKLELENIRLGSNRGTNQGQELMGHRSGYGTDWNRIRLHN